MLTIPGKIPIRIYPLFGIVALGLSLLNGQFHPTLTLLWMLVIFVSVLVHEYGHALTAMAFGQKASIDLVAFGGVTKRHGQTSSAWKEFIIVFNGPLAGFALCLLSYYILKRWETSLPIIMQQLLMISYYANGFWTIVNLLPVQPLDGGHLLRITLQGIFGLKGLKTALFLSFVSSLALAILFFMLGQVLIGSFFLLFTFEGYRAWKNSLAMTAQDDNRALHHFFKNAEKDYRKGQLGYAQHKLNIVRKQAETGVLYTSATLLLAEILEAQGHKDEAYEMLLPFKDQLNPDQQFLLQKLAYEEKQWQTAIQVGTALYQHRPTYEVALLNAKSHAQLSENKPTVGWLQRAIKNGLPHAKEVLADAVFDPVRRDPQFDALQKN